MVTPRLLRVPLESYRVPGVNETLIRVMLTVLIRSAQNRFNEVPFQFDIVTSICSMPVARAANLGVVMPHMAVELSIKTAVGEKKQMRRQGRIQVILPALGRDVFDWPCHFVEGAAAVELPLLGLVGVLDNLRLTLDGKYALEAPHGWLIVERAQ
jgi:hypothetical protein